MNTTALIAASHAAWEQVQRDTTEWGRQLEAFKPGDRMSLLIIGRTPDVMKKLGASDLPMAITSDNLAKAMSSKEDHQLPVSLLKNLPAALAEPVMVFESATRADSFVVLTELRHDDRTVMVSMTLDMIQQRMHINEITSAYKRRSQSWYLSQIEDGRLLYQDKQKSLAWARTDRLQLPRVRRLPARLGSRLLTDEDIVKPVAPQQVRQPVQAASSSPERAFSENTTTRPARDTGRGR